MSCVSPGNCVLAGDYENAGQNVDAPHGFVASEHNGKWDNAINVPKTCTATTRDS
jgi:hypothetical protein